MGPVYLARHGAWALAGHESVGAALRQPRSFALDGTGTADKRTTFPVPLVPESFSAFTDRIDARARKLAAEAVTAGWFDAVALARIFVRGVLRDSGLPEPVANELTPESGVLTSRGMMTALRGVDARQVRGGTWVAALYAAAGAGLVHGEEIPRLIGAHVAAGIPTAVHAIAAALYYLAADPDQLRQVRVGGTAAVRNAVLEALRLYPAISHVTCRVMPGALSPGSLAGVPFAVGDEVWLLLGSAAVDPRRWQRPGWFDCTRRLGDLHVAFGLGPVPDVARAMVLAQASALVLAVTRLCTRLTLDGVAQTVGTGALGSRRLSYVPMFLIPDRKRTRHLIPTS